MTIWQGPAIVCRGGVGAHQGRARFGCYHLQQLQSVDVDGIADAGADGGGVRLRDDEARLPLPQSRALAGAPTEHGHVVVPKFKNV